jgi:polyphosphate glucokinase
MRFGAGRGELGTVLMLTLGTGIGSALFRDGILVPNTELGHLQIRGKDAEHRAAASIKERKGLSWGEWSKLLSEYLNAIDALLWPDLVIIGGGISKDADRFIHNLPARIRCVPAALLNRAGIVGAAMLAAEATHLTAPGVSAGAA